MAECCDPVEIPSNCTKCNQLVDACCVVDETAYTCLGTAAEATQCEINAAINALLCCHTWTDIDVDASGWSELELPAQPPQYSNVKQCIVRLRGTFSRSITSGNTTIGIFTLPVGSRPYYTRSFGFGLVGTNLLAGTYIKINGTSDASPGLVSVYIPTLFSPTSITISFDGLTFETDTP